MRSIMLSFMLLGVLNQSLQVVSQRPLILCMTLFILPFQVCSRYTQGSHILLNIRRLGVPTGYSIATAAPGETGFESTRPAADILTTIIEPQCYSEAEVEDGSPTSSLPTQAESSTSKSTGVATKLCAPEVPLPALRIDSSPA